MIQLLAPADSSLSFRQSEREREKGGLIQPDYLDLSLKANIIAYKSMGPTQELLT